MNRSSSPALKLGSAAFVLVMTTLVFGVGCGATSSPNAGFGDTKVASVAPEAPPQNLSDAEAQFARAEQNVFGALGQNKLENQGQFAQAPGQMAQKPALTSTGPEASPPPLPKDLDRPREGEARATTGAGQTAAADSAALSANPCETACRALASMDRAATHICSLAGDDNDRCMNARERVRSATERVRQSCSECASPP